MTIHLPIINPQSISTILHWCCKGYCDQLSLLLLYVCIWSKRETWIVIILICSFNFLRNSFDVSLLFFIKSNKILFLTTYNLPCESCYTQVGLPTVHFAEKIQPKAQHFPHLSSSMHLKSKDTKIQPFSPRFTYDADPWSESWRGSCLTLVST